MRDTRHNLLKTHMTKLQKEMDVNSRDIKIHSEKFVSQLGLIEDSEQRIFKVKQMYCTNDRMDLLEERFNRFSAIEHVKYL